MSPKPKLLLAGGSGMVGRNVLAHQTVQHWDILAPSSTELDLTNAREVANYIGDHMPNCIIHLAGRVGGIQANIANPVAFLDENVTIGRNLIMGAKAAGVKNFVNVASTCMYPREGDNPLREEAILTGALEPTNEGYALAKIMATRLCDYIRREDETCLYKTLIPCNLYGFYDKFDPNHSHLVPAIIHKIHHARKSGLSSVEIWGDGTARREFMFAADLADMIWWATANLEALPGEMNVGLGFDYTINEYYEAAAQVIGWDGTFTHDTSKPVGMMQKLCSTEKQKTLGWEAPTSLHEGLRLTYQHYLESPFA